MVYGRQKLKKFKKFKKEIKDILEKGIKDKIIIPDSKNNLLLNIPIFEFEVILKESEER